MELLKFCTNIEYLEDLQQGKVYMNGIEYFRKLEQEEKGDENDGSVKLTEGLDLIINEKYKDIVNLKNDRICLSKNYPIFCLSCIDGEFLNNKEYLKLFRDNFGKHMFVFANPNEFVNDFRKYCNSKHYVSIMTFIKYLDNINNLSDVCLDFIAFMKETRYQKQHEFRLTIFNEELTSKKGFVIIDLKKKYSGVIYEITDNYDLRVIREYKDWRDLWEWISYKSF